MNAISESVANVFIDLLSVTDRPSLLGREELPSRALTVMPASIDRGDLAEGVLFLLECLVGQLRDPHDGRDRDEVVADLRQKVNVMTEARAYGEGPQ